MGPSARRLLAAVGAGTAVLLVLGAAASAVFADGSLLRRVFHLDSEFGAAAVWSALLLVLAATAALRRTAESRWFTGFGLLLLALAVDEMFAVHEALERATGVDWQVLYAPLAVLGVAAALGVVQRLRTTGLRGAVPVFLAGGACWVVSQALESLQWDDDVPVANYPLYMLTEEALEMAGAVCFLAALAVRRARVGQDATGSRSPLPG